jgi:hypothetical protein
VLKRPSSYAAVWVFDANIGADPHNIGTASELEQPGGPVEANNLDKTALSTPPQLVDNAALREQLNSHRRFVNGVLRRPGGENVPTIAAAELWDVYAQQGPTYRPRAMPELVGHNPLSNTAPQKFLRLTDTQLFLFAQWAEGKFVNECLEWGSSPGCEDPYAAPPATGEGIDRGVLGNVVGGAFCPGAELTWIMLNPAIWSAPYRIKHASYIPAELSLPEVVASDPDDASSLAAGMEPGDLTKYLAQPWQSDFAQCTTQPIDITYEEWNDLYLDTTGDPAKDRTLYNVPWWPAHRPMVVFTEDGTQVYWDSGIPENNAGGLRMATAWSDLGFLLRREIAETLTSPATIGYPMQERNDTALGPLVEPGNFVEETIERHSTGRSKRAEGR